MLGGGERGVRRNRPARVPVGARPLLLRGELRAADVPVLRGQVDRPDLAGLVAHALLLARQVLPHREVLETHDLTLLGLLLPPDLGLGDVGLAVADVEAETAVNADARARLGLGLAAV